MRFEEFFGQATGKPPYGYQVRLAVEGLPPVLAVPTGAGKTGIILAWLWRRLHGPDPAGTPRRLVYALPQRTLVEQVAAVTGEWLGRLDVDVPLHVVMGGAGQTQGEWRLEVHQPAIVVGTVDSLVSKALNRGYGISRATYPIDFALVTNGAHWVLDEVQLCPESTTTLCQLAGFAAELGTAEPFGLTCMSATVPEGLLDTVDHPAPPDREVVRVGPAERTGELAVRLAATRTVRRLPAEPGDHRAVAAAVRERHRPGTLTPVPVTGLHCGPWVPPGCAGGSESAPGPRDRAPLRSVRPPRPRRSYFACAPGPRDRAPLRFLAGCGDPPHGSAGAPGPRDRAPLRFLARTRLAPPALDVLPVPVTGLHCGFWQAVAIPHMGPQVLPVPVTGLHCGGVGPSVAAPRGGDQPRAPGPRDRAPLRRNHLHARHPGNRSRAPGPRDRAPLRRRSAERVNPCTRVCSRSP